MELAHNGATLFNFNMDEGLPSIKRMNHEKVFKLRRSKAFPPNLRKLETRRSQMHLAGKPNTKKQFQARRKA